MDKSNQVAAAPRFSPGPWRNHVAPRVNGGLVFWIQANPRAGWGNTICTVSSGIDRGNSDLIEPICRANGDLIAAAPDGHALATRFLQFFGDVPPAEYALMVAEDPSVLSQFVEQARAYLAKAEGRSAPTAPPETP